MDIDGTIASAVAFAVTRLFAVYDSRIKPGPLAVPDASTLTGKSLARSNTVFWLIIVRICRSRNYLFPSRSISG